ncbi:MAG: hypothetical protein J6A09_02415 [Alphaproteobacteria bacterium]|nr:hypothetical protein [Alphaproteobacteria bacterium]
MSYKPTVYEQIVLDYTNSELKDYKDYEKEWKARGLIKKDYLQYIKDIAYAESLLALPDVNIVKAANMAKEYVKNRTDIVTFKLSKEEKKTVLEAEDLGRIKNGDVIKYDGYEREIKGVDYLDIPKEADAFVIFSGHPGSGAAAVEAWYNDFKKNGKPKKLVFLGLHDNQGNTNFSDKKLEFNVKSEVEMYVRFFKACGVHKKFVKECLVTPKDISTADNIEMLAEIRNRFFDKDRDVNFVMFGYPAYQKRIASEFAFGFQHLEDEGKVAGTNFYIPDVPVALKEKDRYLSYDDLNGIAQDIIIGNCVAHPYRVSAGGRFDSKLGEYPEKFKPLLPLSMVYSYPNVANELAGTDTHTASIMKILRAMQHQVNGWEDAKKVDMSIKKCACELRKKLIKKGLVSNDIISQKGKGRLKNFVKFFKDSKTR